MITRRSLTNTIHSYRLPLSMVWNITDVKLSETENLVPVADEESQNDTINSKPSDKAVEDKVIDEESQDDSINSNTESHAGDALIDVLPNTEMNNSMDM